MAASGCALGATSYLVRHGETASNLLVRYAGQSRESLTARGREQALGLAKRLTAYSVAEIWTSKIPRAAETAEILADVLGVTVRTEKRLGEIRMGPWEGLTETEVAEKHPTSFRVWQEHPDLLSLPGRETLEMVAARVRTVLVEARARRKPVVLVSHVAPIRVAVLIHLGLPLRLYKRIRVANTDCFAASGEPLDVRRLGQPASMRGELEPAALL